MRACSERCTDTSTVSHKFTTQFFKLTSVGCNTDSFCMEDMTGHVIHFKTNRTYCLTFIGKDFKYIDTV